MDSRCETLGLDASKQVGGVLGLRIDHRRVLTPKMRASELCDAEAKRKILVLESRG